MRELENTIERAVVLSQGELICLEDIMPFNQKVENLEPQKDFITTMLSESKVLTVEELINKYVKHVLKLNHGVKDKTAKDLQIDRKTLYRRLRDIDSSSHQMSELN